MNNLLYFPCFAMLILTASVLVIMFLTRVKALKDKQVKMSYFKTYQSADTSLPETMLKASRNFTNLFEVPTLFYMVCLFATALNQVDLVLVGLAWTYVVLRVVHSIVHITINNITMRMTVYALSWIVLIIMASRLALKLMFLNFI